MKQALILGLIAAGTVGAALGVARTDPSVGGYIGTVQVHGPLTAVSLALLVAGIVARRWLVRAQGAAAMREGGSLQALRAAAASITSQIDSLDAGLEELPAEALHARLDQLSTEALASLAENRQALADAFGAEAYAAVMTAFASGERAVNRAWSASADGYRDEAVASVRRAVPELRHACQQIQQLG